LQAGSSSGSNLGGNGTGGTQNFFIGNLQPNNQDISVPICGRIPAGQGAGVGNYTNTLMATINS